ncbi:MAG TPA: GntR family transcriptional regulator [Bryobacteraceae bacterium]|nr:GntR family transcriptional regulator [Bryobacteraceae bacterium]
MIRLWLSRDKSIPVREQLGAQLLFGILSRRMPPGERLPSVRDLARRLKVHPNTVSAAYQDLAERGWVLQKRGSGVFVRDLAMPEPAGGAEGLVRAWIEEGLQHGFTIDAIEAAVSKVARELRGQAAPRNFLVVHPDRELARVLAAEIEESVTCPVSSTGFDLAAKELAPDTCVLVTAACASQAVKELQPSYCRVIRLRSMEDAIAGQHPPTSGLLIAVVSRSKSILQWSATLLASLGFPGMDILERNPEEPGWQDGLAACDIVAADIKSARELPKAVKPTVFRIVADDFLAELRALVTEQKV